MADHRIHAPVEKRPGGCPATPGMPGARHLHPPYPAQVCTPLALGVEVSNEQTRRFQLASWLVEQDSRQLVQRAHSALLLVLGNVLLAAVTFLLSFLVSVINQDWWLVLIGAGLILICVLVSTLLALLAGVNLPSGGSPALDTGLFFRSGQTLPLSAAQFNERFLHATRQQMLEGALGELYAHKRRRARQERWLRWAMLAYVLALLLFTLATVGLLVLLVW